MPKTLEKIEWTCPNCSITQRADPKDGLPACGGCFEIFDWEEVVPEMKNKVLENDDVIAKLNAFADKWEVAWNDNPKEKHMKKTYHFEAEQIRRLGRLVQKNKWYHIRALIGLFDTHMKNSLPQEIWTWLGEKSKAY